MRILLTGGTGFLGQHVISQLLANPAVTKIDVVTRQGRRRREDPRVSSVTCDLSQPEQVARLPFAQADAVIHLAGHYQLFDPLVVNFRNNVLVTDLITSQLRPGCPFVYASTYAVLPEIHDPRLDDLGGEVALSEIAPLSMPYPHTKGLAEKIVAERVPHAAILRFGIIVGDHQQGDISKIDGPYYVMELLQKIRNADHLRLHQRIPLPIPFDPQIQVPFVPVDLAAKVAVACAVNPSPARQGVFGVYRYRDLTFGEFFARLFSNCFPEFKYVPIPHLPKSLAPIASKLMSIPEDAFYFASKRQSLTNKRFEKVFGADFIPPFLSYEKAFYQGFYRFAAGHQPQHTPAVQLSRLGTSP